jgi:hypothetical protein
MAAVLAQAEVPYAVVMITCAMCEAGGIVRTIVAVVVDSRSDRVAKGEQDVVVVSRRQTDCVLQVFCDRRESQAR